MKVSSLVFGGFVAATLLSSAALAHEAPSSQMSTDTGSMPMDAPKVHDHADHMVTELPGGLIIEHPMLLIVGKLAKSATAYLVIENPTESDDRLVGVAADFANSATLHTHIFENDVAMMREVKDGFSIPAGGTRALARGGDHIMITGLKTVPEIGETVDLTLTFEMAGTVHVPFIAMGAGSAGAMPHMMHDTN